mmetsp:Transcript_14728/g.39452  ORF Transcript_14728/g.39452 Transcript_14728/m.39452 type:complete len:279 (+) Transcript_14728:110-946(+)
MSAGAMTVGWLAPAQVKAQPFRMPRAKACSAPMRSVARTPLKAGLFDRPVLDDPLTELNAAPGHVKTSKSVPERVVSATKSAPERAVSATKSAPDSAVSAAQSLSPRTALLVLVLLPQILGMWAGAATRKSILGWYKDLRKPWYTPPGPLFGPIWSVLYLCMGYASFLVYKSTIYASGVMPVVCIALYVLQLVLNIRWQLVFFNGRRLRDALNLIYALWVSIAACTIAFARVNTTAAGYMLPYLAFVTLAAAINDGIIRLNPELIDPSASTGGNARIA